MADRFAVSHELIAPLDEKQSSEGPWSNVTMLKPCAAQELVILIDAYEVVRWHGLGDAESDKQNACTLEQLFVRNLQYCSRTMQHAVWLLTISSLCCRMRIKLRSQFCTSFGMI